MDWSNQKVVLAVGTAVALIAGVILAVLFMGRSPKPAAAPAAAQGGLQVSVNNTPPLDTSKKLRCFVDGVPVGEFSLAECAQKNGVSAQALDVGLDDNGNLAAAPTASLAPPPALPPAAAQPAQPGAPVQEQRPQATAQPPLQTAQARGGATACLRFSSGEWRQVAAAMSLNDCVQALFAGHCVHPGEADYGRFGETTLRLVPGRVEQSTDNTHFRLLTEQRRGCEIPSAH
jgi:hypothetical protein